jgi:hypothetical protein
VDISDRYAEKSAVWPKVMIFVFVIWWIYAFASDMGILWRLTKNWETPLGNPPAGMTAPSVPKSDTAAADAKAAAAKAAAEAAAKAAAPAK